MPALIAFIICILTCIPTLHARIPRTVFPSEIYHLMFGDLLDIDHLMIPDDSAPTKPPDPALATNISFGQLLSDAYKIGSLSDIFDSFKDPLNGTGGSDSREFDQINFDMYTHYRRHGYEYNEAWLGSTDPLDSAWWDCQPWCTGTEHQERMKGLLLKGVATQYVLSSRDKIAGAIRMRNKIRHDKRYKLGYLFYRLRRLKTQMLKCISTQTYQIEDHQNYNDLRPVSMTAIMLYEAVVRLDIDIRDTIAYINEIYNTYDKMDYDYFPIENENN